MSAHVVPLTSAENQSLTVQLTVNGSSLTLNLFVAYSAMAGYWWMQVSDVNNNILIGSVPLVTGLYPGANLLAQYRYLQIGAAYLLNTGNDAQDYPGPGTLGDFSLVWADNTSS